MALEFLCFGLLVSNIQSSRRSPDFCSDILVLLSDFHRQQALIHCRNSGFIAIKGNLRIETVTNDAVCAGTSLLGQCLSGFNQLADVVYCFECLVDVLDRLCLLVQKAAEIAGFLGKCLRREVGRGIIDGRVDLLAGRETVLGGGDEINS